MYDTYILCYFAANDTIYKYLLYIYIYIFAATDNNKCVMHRACVTLSNTLINLSERQPLSGHTRACVRNSNPFICYSGQLKLN